MKCSKCGAPMEQLFTSSVCSKDCHKESDFQRLAKEFFRVKHILAEGHRLNQVPENHRALQMQATDLMNQLVGMGASVLRVPGCMGGIVAVFKDGQKVEYEYQVPV